MLKINPQVRRIVELAIEEDLGTGDVTTEACVPPEARVVGQIVAKSPGILAGTAGPVVKELGLKLILEPGRSLVASAGALAVKTLYRKKSGVRSYIITDGAMNDFIRPALYGARHPVRPLLKRFGKAVRFDIAGPVCESGDFLAQNVRMHAPSPGDILLILSAGAYGFSMSSQYNSRPRAAEVLITGNKTWRLIRERETYEDLINREK